MVGSREGPSTGGETLTAVTVSSQGKQRSPECDQGLWVFLGQLHRDLCSENRKVHDVCSDDLFFLFSIGKSCQNLSPGFSVRWES